MRHIDICDYCCEWSNDHRGCDPKKVCDDYPEMMTTVLVERFGMSQAAADTFIETACEGNWERMHETDDEKALSAEYYRDELLGDVWYCSDRWSWDRIIRNQWRYKRIMYRLNGWV